MEGSHLRTEAPHHKLTPGSRQRQPHVAAAEDRCMGRYQRGGSAGGSEALPSPWCCIVRRFHNYVLSAVQKKASESLGTQVQLQNYASHLANLSLDVYGLTVHGADPYPNPPLLQVAHAEAGVRIVSVLHRSGISTALWSIARWSKCLPMRMA